VPNGAQEARAAALRRVVVGATGDVALAVLDR